MSDADAIIVRILATSDALRLALRSWSLRAAANRGQRLWTLAAKGVPYRVNTSGDEAGRKAGERELIDVAGKGWIALTRDRTKWPHCKLTPLGDAIGRALCGLPDRKVARLILKAVAAKTDREPKTLDRGWLAEIELNSGKGWGFDATREDRRGLSLIEQDFLAAAVAGWLVAHSDCKGRCYYCVTPAGWQELDTPSASPRFGKLPKFSDAAAKLYRQVQDVRLAALATEDPPSAQEIGTIPLPVSMFGVKFDATVVAWLGSETGPDIANDEPHDIDDQDADTDELK